MHQVLCVGYDYIVGGGDCQGYRKNCCASLRRTLVFFRDSDRLPMLLDWVFYPAELYPCGEKWFSNMFLFDEFNVSLVRTRVLEFMVRVCLFRLLFAPRDSNEC